MTSKERIMNAILGKETDRVPWSPFLAYYWEHLPEAERACGQVEYMKKMGADPLLRGFNLLFRTEYKNCKISETVSGGQSVRRYETKVGALTEIRTYSKTANSWFLTGHAVKTKADLQTLQYMMENIRISENAAPFEEEFKALGSGAVTVPSIGIHSKTAFQSLVEQWFGTEALVYALCDYPEAVEECLAVMRGKDMETVRISINSSAEIFNFFEDSSTTNISPSLFERYTLPEINEWGKAIHSAGKLLLHHACGHLRDLLPLIAESDIDVLESVSPPPTGNIDIGEAAEMLPERIAIIGGIEPTFFENCSLDSLERRVISLLDSMKGRRYVLANSDSCPPNVSYEKFLLVSDTVRKHSSR
ncbi:MAG: hypothetical protein K6D94_09480 [Clostridiales bacterium]|nr:hypothetical protein [Clostridiales bacterium]